VGPRELKKLTTVFERKVEPRVLAEPTVITAGSSPGDPIEPYCSWPEALRPKLPAAATTVMPAATALRAARASGSVR
jgi:hypothetical protein